MPDPFLVLATQNPIETEGTYALPEAQIDRFMLKVLVGYPSPTEEFVIVERMTGAFPVVHDGPLDRCPAQDAAEPPTSVYVDPALMEYAVRLATATREPEGHGLGELARYITFGASPRASINLILTARALAFVRGRDYALPEDVLDMALDVLRHRLVLSFEALSDDVSSDDLLDTILDRIPVPVVPTPRAWQRPRQRLSASSSASTGRSSAGSTACCRATTGRCSTAAASTSPTCANTSTATTSATSIGT